MSTEQRLDSDKKRRPEGGVVSQLWSHPWVRWVGLRYLKSKKNSRFLSFITFISIAGVGLGVAAMIIVLSVMDGFEVELKKRLMSSDLHVLITPTREVPGFEGGFVPSGSLDIQKTIAALPSRSDVAGAWPIIASEAVLKTARRVTGVVVKGITPERMELLKKQITESADPQMMVQREGGETVRLPGIYVGQELAFEMQMLPGDQVTLVSPTQTEGPLSAVPRLKRFVIEGIYHSGTAEQELHTVFSLDSSVRSFLRRADVISQWEITVRDFQRAPQVGAELRARHPGFRVKDWIQMNSSLFASLRLERIAMFVVLAFIIVVASFNIVTTLTLMVLEKKKEISILKAMGAREGQVAAIFVFEGLLIGLLGTGFGVTVGAVVCFVLRRYSPITLPDFYYDRSLPVTFDPVYYVLIATAALMIVLAACLYPSRRAAAINPLEGIRFG